MSVYMDRHCARLEEVLSCAMDALSKEEPADPVAFLSAALSHAAEASDDTETTSVAAEAVRCAAAAAQEGDHPGAESAIAADWSPEDWVDGLGVTDIVTAALFSPVAQSSVPKIEYARALGRVGSRAEVLRLLRQGSVVNDVADALWRGLERLSAGHASSGAELHEKFVSGGAGFTLAFGSLGHFYAGLEGLVGPPSAHLSEAMRNEHCGSADSDEEVHACHAKWLLLLPPLPPFPTSSLPPSLPLPSGSHRRVLRHPPATAVLRGQLRDEDDVAD